MMKAVIDCSIYESVAGSGIVKQARRAVEAPVSMSPWALAEIKFVKGPRL